MVGIFCMLLAILYSTLCFASQGKTIFGEDNRLDIYQVKNSKYLQWARSTAAMVAKSDIVSVLGPVGNTVTLNAQTLFDTGVCSSEPFAEQIIPSYCTGFLVADNLLVTAGHCLNSENECLDYAWVFDFHMKSKKQLAKLTDNSVYHCKRVVERVLDDSTWQDHALIELDRPVTGRAPLKYRKQGVVVEGTPLVIIGHPLGLPKKIADGATVTEVQDIFFYANLDSYAGNSGSPVFNDATGEVEGILVRGEEDFTETSEGCKLSLKIDDDDEDAGQEINFITNIKELMK